MLGAWAAGVGIDELNDYLLGFGELEDASTTGDSGTESTGLAVGCLAIK